VLEGIRELIERDPLAFEQPHQEAGVDAARAGCHDEPLERGEAHGGVA